MRQRRIIVVIASTMVGLTVLAGCPLTTPPGSVNAPPVADAVEATAIGSEPVTIELAAADPDGDELTVSVSSGPSNGTLTVSSATTAVYTANGGFAGVDTFRYEVSDGRATSAPGEVTVTVYPEPAGSTVTLDVMEVVLVRGEAHMAAGASAREEMLASTMVYQRLLAEDLELYFLIREHPDAVRLVADPDPIDVNDLFGQFRTWKETNLDVDAGSGGDPPFQPTGVFYSDREWSGSGTIGLSFLKAFGRNIAVTVISRRDPFTSGPLSLNLQIENAAQQMGHILGAEHPPIDVPDESIMEATLVEVDADDLVFLPSSLTQMQEAIDEDTAPTLPTIDAHPVAAAAADGAVLLAWDDALPGDELVLYRSADSVPLSCFTCTTVELNGGTRVYTDPDVSAGQTYRYRVMSRDSSGDLAGVTQEAVVTVP
ncbi:MAG: Ig-like domain-containing protein [bacterium]